LKGQKVHDLHSLRALTGTNEENKKMPSNRHRTKLAASLLHEKSCGKETRAAGLLKSSRGAVKERKKNDAGAS